MKSVPAAYAFYPFYSSPVGETHHCSTDRGTCLHRDVAADKHPVADNYMMKVLDAKSAAYADAPPSSAS